MRHSETRADYLDRSARPEMGAMRELWETWFARYPRDPAPTTEAGTSLRKALRGRLRSRRPRQQTEAFWELYLHESLLRAGCHVLARADTPDFEVSVGHVRFQLEATVRGDSSDETAAGNRVAALRDGIERAKTGPWKLEVSADIDSTSPPPIDELRRRIERWLRDLDVVAVRGQAIKNGRIDFSAFPATMVEVEGYRLYVRAHPLREGVTGRSDGRAIGIWGGPVVPVENATPLVDSLDMKARAVRGLSGPVVIAVLLDRSFASEDDFESALFGTELLDIPTRRGSADGIVVRVRRGDDGFWTATGRGERVDAVLSATCWDPARISRNTPTLWSNPARWRQAFDVPAALPWRRRWINDAGALCTADAPAPAEFFGLPVSWPE